MINKIINRIITCFVSKEERTKIFCIFGIYSKLDDITFLKKIYRDIMKRDLNLSNPRSFNEKIQWLKLYDRNPLYTTMVDKYEVKKYIDWKLGAGYTIPTLKVWDSIDEIQLNDLPNQFVLKCTHDSGGVVICKDKTKFNLHKAKSKLKKCLKRNYYSIWREWPYKNVKPRIICEKYMENTDLKGEGLRDYKFFCFNGKVKYLYISEGLINHSTARISFVTPDWKPEKFGRKDYLSFDNLPEKPDNLKEMINVAEKLAFSIPFVRIDLYSVDKKIYFSEFTFSPCGGFMPFNPEEWDLKLGDELVLPTRGEGFYVEN